MEGGAALDDDDDDDQVTKTKDSRGLVHTDLGVHQKPCKGLLGVVRSPSPL